MEQAPQIFDRDLLARRRTRAASDFASARFLHEEVGARLIERLDEIKRSFPFAVNLGAMDGHLTPQLLGQNGIERVLQLELCEELARQMQTTATNPEQARPTTTHLCQTIVADEEWLPLRPQSVDLVISNLALHWVNDLPGALAQIRMALKPDGLFMAAILGGETLFELRRCLMEAEMEATGGISPRLSPLTEVRDAGGLLQRAGLALPVVDRETITVTYADPIKLLYDLRAMGATNLTHNRPRKPLRRAVLMDALSRYRQHFTVEEGRVQATFEVIYLAGWAPHESQQKPAARGSGTHSLVEALLPKNQA